MSVDASAKSGDSVAGAQGRLEDLEKCVSRVTSALSPSHLSQTTATRSPRNRVACCRKYDVEPRSCKGFLLQTFIYYASLGSLSDNQKVAEFTVLLEGKALCWATAVWEAEDETFSSFERFLGLFHQVFEHCPEGEASEQLLTLSQANRHTAVYVLEFLTPAAGREWNKPVLKAAFRWGLNEEILTKISCCDELLSLDSLIDLAIRLDNLLWRRPALLNQPMLPDTMQISCTHLNAIERERRRLEQLCFYCGKPGHIICLCPKLHKQLDMPERESGVSATLRPFSTVSHFCVILQVQIWHSKRTFALPALIDCGSTGNFIDWDTVAKLQLPVTQLHQPLCLSAIDRGPIGSGQVTHCTRPIHLQVSAAHHETTSLMITVTRHPIVLGMPWLQLHDPHISWHHREITHWSKYCHRHCLKIPKPRLHLHQKVQ